MNRENCRDECALPQTVGCPSQENKKQHCRRAVEKNIYQVVRARIHSEQLAVEHVRDRRQRMPVLRMDMRERPDNPAPGQARAHVRVVEHVKRIVIIDELMAERLSKHRPRDRDQNDNDAE